MLLDTKAALAMRKPRGFFGADPVSAEPSFDEVFAPYRRPDVPALPGPVSGYGGGTWNADGSPATPDAGGAMRPLPGSARTGGIFGRGAPVARAVPVNEGHARQMDRSTAQANGGPLGGSMRQPFDYEAARKVLEGQQKKIADWRWIVAGLGAALGNPSGLQTLFNQRNAMRDRRQKAGETLLGWQHDAWNDQNEADLKAAAPFTIGRDRLAYDPASGQVSTLYDGQEDYQLYADTLGLEPGSPEYFKAVEDYVLRSSGPSAYDRDVSLDDHRTANDSTLENQRYGNRLKMELARQGNRIGMVDYRNAHPAPRGGAPRDNIVSVRTPAEARALPSGTKFRTPDGKVKVVP